MAERFCRKDRTPVVGEGMRNEECGVRNNDLRLRTKRFALDVIAFVNSLPRTRADFISKMGIVEEESDESLYWMELLVESSVVKKDLIARLMTEADELTAIIVASIKTARGGSR